MKLNCPKCQALLDCQASNIQNCSCQTLKLSPEVQSFLKQSHFKTCLCKNCLEQLEELREKAKQYPFPKPPQRLVEHLHYYQEKGFWVFTELYHFSRGYCCQSGCRHCPYGFKKTMK